MSVGVPKWCGLALLLTAPMVVAQGAGDVRLRGSVAALALDASDVLAGKKHTLGVNGRMEVEAGLNSDLDVRFKVERSSSRDFGNQTRDHWLSEAFLRYQGEYVDLTLGRQYLPAGRTDLMTLQDQFAPRDLTVQGLEDSEQRLALPAVRVDYFPDEVWTLTAAVIRQDRGYGMPFAVRTMLPGLGALNHDPAMGGLLRAEYRNGAWEGALGLGWGRSPFSVFPLADAARPTEATFPKERRLSFDGTLTTDHGVLRWDAVYARRSIDGSYPGVSSSRWSAAIGFDRPLWADATLTAQWIYRNSGSVRDVAPSLADLARINRAVSLEFQSSQQWATFSLKQALGDAHDLEGIVIAGNARQRGVVARWSWKVADSWGFGVRAQALSGRSDTLLKRLGPERQVYVELRRHFSRE